MRPPLGDTGALARAADKFGAAFPPWLLGRASELIDWTGHNSLVPGRAPVEFSYSSRAPSHFRVALEFGSASWSSDVRVKESLALVAEAVATDLNSWEQLRPQFNSHLRDLELWQTVPGFGAFVGFSADAHGLSSAEVYLAASSCAGPFAVRASRLPLPGDMEDLDLDLRFVGVDVDRNACRMTRYYALQEALTLRQLVRRLTLTHRGAELSHVVSAVGTMLPEGGMLPKGSVVLSCNDSNIKIEISARGLLIDYSDALVVMARLQERRGPALKLLGRWAETAETGGPSGPIATVFSIQLGRAGPPCLYLYVSPNWFGRADSA